MYYREALRAAQLAERLSLEDAHAAEYSDLKLRCEGIIARYNEKAQQLVDAMKERHEQERCVQPRVIKGV